jgi:hypothetical protein
VTNEGRWKDQECGLDEGELRCARAHVDLPAAESHSDMMKDGWCVLLKKEGC